uniref:Uncharacterized protein n=1 Tax=Ditylenchus dipsaci TaxID=166011 RepID=A0A915CRD2_9BILA
MQSWDELQQNIESCPPPIQLVHIEQFKFDKNFVDYFCAINTSYFTEVRMKLRQVDFTSHPQAFHEFFGSNMMPHSIIFEDIEGVPDFPAAINQLPALSEASFLEILVGNGLHDNIQISQQQIISFLHNNHPYNGIKAIRVDVDYLQDSLEAIVTKFYQVTIKNYCGISQPIWLSGKFVIDPME